MRPKVIVDTDAGHDDALALMLLVKSKRFDIKAVTTVAGNSNINNVTRNAAFILNLLGRRDIPLYSGQPNPLKRKLIQAVVHGASGLDGVDTSKTVYKLTGDADRQMIKLIKAYPHKVTVVTIGPLSNLARAFIKDPKLPGLIRRLIIMGGAISVCGNKSRVAEFNIFVDPEAADIVFRAEVKKIMVPLDPCNEIVLSLQDFDKLKGSDLFRPIKSMMRKFIKGIEKDEGVKGALVYDALAVYYLINPRACKLEPMDIVIEREGEHTSGMTVVEKRISKKKNYNVGVVMRIDKKVFIKDFVRIIKS